MSHPREPCSSGSRRPRPAHLPSRSGSSQLKHAAAVDASGDLLMTGRAPVRAEPNYRGNIKDPIVYDEGPDPKGMRFAARARVLRTDGRIERGPSSLAVAGAREALVAIALDTSFAGFDREPSGGPDPVPATRATLDAAARQPYAALRLAHARDVEALMSRVALDLGRPARDEIPTDVRLRECGRRRGPRPRGALLPVRPLPASGRVRARRRSTCRASGTLTCARPGAASTRSTSTRR